MLLAITWAWAWPVLLGVVAALAVHEAGHIVAALAVGLAPRLLLLGCGPTLARLVLPGFTLMVRAVPTEGLVLVEPTDRRWADVAMTAGGPLANLVALAACLWPGAPWSGTGNAPTLAAYQGLFALVALCPARASVGGLAVGTDGLRILRSLRRFERPKVADAYAGLLAPLQPLDDPPHLPTRHAGRVLFEHAAAPSLAGARTPRDTLAWLLALLREGDLTRIERAFALCWACSLDGRGPGESLGPDDLDARSREAVDLAPEPMVRAARGAALLRLGRADAAEPALRAALAGFADRGEGGGEHAVACRASLTRLLIAAGRQGEAAALWPSRGPPPAAEFVGELPLVLRLIREKAYPGAAPLAAAP